MDSCEGKKRYNAICKGVKAEREKQELKQKEIWLLKKWAKEKDKDKSGRNKQKQVEDVEAWEKAKEGIGRV